MPCAQAGASPCKGRACAPSVSLVGHSAVVGNECSVKNEPQGHALQGASPTLLLAKRQSMRRSVSNTSSHSITSCVAQGFDTLASQLTATSRPRTARSWADTSAFGMTLQHVRVVVGSAVDLQTVLASICCGWLRTTNAMAHIAPAVGIRFASSAVRAALNCTFSLRGEL